MRELKFGWSFTEVEFLERFFGKNIARASTNIFVNVCKFITCIFSGCVCCAYTKLPVIVAAFGEFHAIIAVAIYGVIRAVFTFV